MGRNRKPENEIKRHSIWYRKYREQVKAGTYKPDTKYTPELTKDYLMNDLGLEIFEDETSPTGWIVTQTNPRTGKVHVCPQRLSNTKIKYIIAVVTDYPEYRLTKSRSGKTIALHRIIYVLKKENIPLGYTVDHIDNNPWNNKIENLQLLTRGENTLKALGDRWKNNLKDAKNIS